MKRLMLLILLLAPMCLRAQEGVSTSLGVGAESVEIDSAVFVVDSLPAETERVIQELMHSMMMEYVAMEIGDCQTAPTGTTCSDSVYIDRLSSLPCVIEMPFNSHVRDAIDAYVLSRRRQVSYLLGMASYYFPRIEECLNRYELPLELRVLPVVESAFNNTAVSRAGAAGLWQFMLQTGRAYGLDVNTLIDERMNPIKSTDAACRYLKSLYRIYGDWHLAIAAYNCGSGTLNKAIARSGGKRDFWAIYPYLPKQTRAYVPAFIAANYIMNYYEEHHICPAHVSLPYQTDTVMTARRIHLQQIADVLGMEKDEVRLLNPQYRRDVIPGGASYSVCLPADLAPMFIAKEEEICAYKSDSLIARRALVEPVGNANTKGRSGTSKGNSTVYVVKKGDSLSKIAKQYHVTVSQLRKWNNCSNNLRIGQKIRILK